MSSIYYCTKNDRNTFKTMSDRCAIAVIKKYVYGKGFTADKLKSLLYINPENVSNEGLFHDIEFLIKYLKGKKPYKTRVLLTKLTLTRLADTLAKTAVEAREAIISSIHIVNCSICGKDKKLVKQAKLTLKNYKSINYLKKGGE